MKPLVAVLSVLVLLAGAAAGGFYAGQHHMTDPADDLHANHDHSASELYICPMHPQISSENAEDTCPICGMDLVPAAEVDQSATPAGSASESTSATAHNHADSALYICPMHPQITSENPEDTCPICGMDLVPATEVEGSSSEAEMPTGLAEVNISGARPQLIGLKTSTVAEKPLFRTVRAPGRAAFDPELYTAQAEYQQALRQAERVKDSPLTSVKNNVNRMLESSRVRLRVLGLSDREIRAIKPNADISDALLVYKQGGTVWIYADVFESDLTGLEPGQTAKLTAGYFQGREIAGRVTSTDQVVDPQTRTAKVRIKVEKSPVNIRAESFVNVEILVPLGEHLVVPLDAIVDTGEETYVFVRTGENQLEPRAVTIKLQADDEVAIDSGLSAGDQIVTSGNFLVNSESQLRGVIRDMTR